MSADAPEPGDARMFPFVIPWDDASESAANVSHWNEKPAGRHGVVRVRNGHFADGRGKRIRFFGTNLCFAGCFPPHAVAERVAPRMAKLGINIVRFHHMDSRPLPNGILDPAHADKQHLSAEALDRLDYLIHQLKLSGIYVNINLHVSRKLGEADGIEQADAMPRMDKGVDNFHPRMIELQRNYARDLLTHVNPYTGNAYADEPAVAMVELNNENSLTTIWRRGELDGLPEYCRAMLDDRWHRWLEARYGDTEAIREAWSEGAAPLGDEMLSNRDFGAGTDGWTLEVHAPARAAAEPVSAGPDGRPAMQITIPEPTDPGWYVQFHQAGLDFEDDAPYTFSFWARAEPARRISANNFATREPWHPLGFQGSAEIGSEWRRYSFGFRANETYAGGRAGFGDLASAAGALWIADVSLRPGGVRGLREGETLPARTVPRPRRSDMAGCSPPLQRDYVEFLLDVEREYWTGMAEFLRADLGVKSPITGTQMGYTPIGTHVAMDYFDAHAYWHHPWFPGRAWDSNDWWVTNESMVSAKGGTLPSLAARRVAGYPYTIS
ncbi:MAG: carbohydrate binding domain-containing protein, partial [Armatimonadota bacterium]